MFFWFLFCGDWALGRHYLDLAYYFLGDHVLVIKFLNGDGIAKFPGKRTCSGPGRAAAVLCEVLRGAFAVEFLAAGFCGNGVFRMSSESEEREMKVPQSNGVSCSLILPFSVGPQFLGDHACQFDVFPR